MENKLTRRWCICGMSISLLMVSGQPLAEDAPVAPQGRFTKILSAGVAYTDNALNVDVGEASDLEYFARLNLAFRKDSRRWRAALDYQLSRIEYLENYLQGKTALTGESSFSLSTNPQRYAWSLDHQQAHTQVDSRAADIQSNRDVRSILSTGPDATLRLSPVDQLEGGLRYIETSFRDGLGVDSTRKGGSVLLHHQLSSSATVSLGATHLDANIDGFGVDYQRTQFTLGFNGKFRSGEYRLTLGDALIERDIGEDIDGTYAVLSLVYTGQSKTFGLLANHELTDSSVGLSLSTGLGGKFVNGDENFDKAGIVERTRFQLYYATVGTGDAFDYTLSVQADREDYVALAEDEESLSAALELKYVIAQNMDFKLGMSLMDLRYTDQPLQGEDRIAKVVFALDHSIDEKLGFRYEVIASSRSNDIEFGRDYDKRLVAVSVRYQFD